MCGNKLDPKAEYAHLRLWCRMMGSSQYYADTQVERAKAMLAPPTAIYVRDGVWMVAEDITSRETRGVFRRHGLGFPHWDLDEGYQDMVAALRDLKSAGVKVYETYERHQVFNDFKPGHPIHDLTLKVYTAPVDEWLVLVHELQLAWQKEADAFKEAALAKPHG
jgi:hypothetical protein